MQHQHCNLLLQRSQNMVCSLLKHTKPWPSSQTPANHNKFFEVAHSPPQKHHIAVMYLEQYKFKVVPFSEQFTSNVDTKFNLNSADTGLTTRLLPLSTSTLLPRTTNGKFSTSDGLACPKLIAKILSNQATLETDSAQKQVLWKVLPEWETHHANCQGCQMTSSH